jgi:hypothetical protein
MAEGDRSTEMADYVAAYGGIRVVVDTFMCRECSQPFNAVLRNTNVRDQ